MWPNVGFRRAVFGLGHLARRWAACDVPSIGDPPFRVRVLYYNTRNLRTDALICQP